MTPRPQVHQGVDDGHTIVVPFCEKCPPLKEWADKTLALGACPICGRLHENGWREAAARRLLKERGLR